MTGITKGIPVKDTKSLHDRDDLGLEGREITIDILNAKPVIKVRANAGRPEIV